MILVTGASGFVGTALMQMLAERGFHARGVSRTQKDNLEVIADISPRTDWSTVLTGIETVVHLAARVHQMNETEQDAVAAFRRANTEATTNLARQAAAAGIKRFIFVSSVKVNGEETPEGRPFTEYDVFNPQDPYGISKAEAEKGIREIASATGMNVVVVRPPLVYGPGVKANFQAMMRFVKRNIPLPLASVENRRSMVSVGNLCDLLVHCIGHPAAANQTFFVSDGRDLSTPELLRMVALSLGQPARLFPFPVWLLHAGARAAGKEVFARRLLGSLQVDIGKAQALLQWSPPQDVEQAVDATVAHFRQTISDR